MKNIKYSGHPIDRNINYLGYDNKGTVLFDGWLLGGVVDNVVVYSSEGKWKGRKIAEFKLKK
jgi:hypothetical protein